jgi:hypothetical protein
MSTRSFIGYRTDKIKGVYCHSDGYPGGVGQSLLDFVKLGDVETLIQLIIEDRPSGWSFLTEWEGDPDKLIGYDDFYRGPVGEVKFNKGFGVYYDGQRADTGDAVEVYLTAHDMITDSLSWYEYFYILDPEKQRIEVYDKYRPNSVWFVDVRVKDMPVEDN